MNDHGSARGAPQRALGRALAGILAVLALAAAARAQVAAGGVPAFAGTSHVLVPQHAGFALRHGDLPIAVEEVSARVAILEQTATTEIEVRVRNPGARIAEAILLLPVPDGAAVSAFSFDGPAAEPTARILPKDEARRLYESIVARTRDPALLEFAGLNVVRSSVFPVPPGGTQRLRISYHHLLAADGDRVDYVLPRSESLEVRTPWTVRIEVRAKHPVSMVYSPSHDLRIARTAGGRFVIEGGAAALAQPGPLRVSFLLARPGIAASLLAYPDPAVQGGYFLLMAGLPPPDAAAAPPVRREVTLVIDRSGSMAGPKIRQVVEAARQVVEGLDDGEAFNVIDYGTTVSLFAPAPVVKDAASIARARTYLAELRPGGGTNIHDALVEALRQERRPGMLALVLFLTDGLPTVGRTSEVAIRELASTANPAGRRVFTFGVGADVNVPLLDRIAEVTRGKSVYVLPGEDVEVKVAQVFRQLKGPILADVRLETLDAAGAVTTQAVRELMPSPIPDLFEGDQLVLLGQYRGAGPLDFRLSGTDRGRARTFAFKFALDGATTRNAFVARLWASRRIGFLVDQIRQDGADAAFDPAVAAASPDVSRRHRELLDEILRLSTEFGILSEYTAFLATEGTATASWSDLRVACGDNLGRRAVRSRSGLGAVNQGLNVAEQKTRSSLDYNNCFFDENMNRVAITSVQQVCDRAFFKRGERWVDSRLVGGAEAEPPHRSVTIGSPEYSQILERLVGEGRAGVLSLRGELLLRIGDERILIRAPEN